MGNYKDKNDRSSSYHHSSYDNKGSGRNNFGENMGPKTMYPTTCSKCGKNCEVPFRPNGKKPVFCSSCHNEMKESNFSTGFGGASSSRPNRNSSFGGFNRSISHPLYKEQFEALNIKLDKILLALGQVEKPKKMKEPYVSKKDRIQTESLDLTSSDDDSIE